jgi:hypothetical protein
MTVGLLGEIHHARLMYHRNRSWRRDTPPPSAEYSPARWGYPAWDHLVNWRLYRKYSQELVAELGGHQISTANLSSTPPRPRSWEAAASIASRTVRSTTTSS